MPINNQLYNSVATQRRDAVRSYEPIDIIPRSTELTERQQHNLDVHGNIHGSYQERHQPKYPNIDPGTITELAPGSVEKANAQDRALEIVGWQNKAGNAGPLQGLTKTVGASAAIALGAGHMGTATTVLGLGESLLAGAVGMEGYAMLEGRLATPNELAYGAAAQMGIPLAIKALQMIGQVPGTIGAAKDLYDEAVSRIPKGPIDVPYSEVKPTSIGSRDLTWWQNKQYDLHQAKRTAIQKGKEAVQPVRNALQDLKNHRDYMKSLRSDDNIFSNISRYKYDHYGYRGSVWEISLKEDPANSLAELNAKNSDLVWKEFRDRVYWSGDFAGKNTRMMHYLTEKERLPEFQKVTTLSDVKVRDSALITEKLLENVKDKKILTPYLGWKLHDYSEFNLRTPYKTVGEFRKAIESGEFKIPQKYRDELAEVIIEQEKIYNAKVSGSAILTRDGYINKYPGDIDLYQSIPGAPKQITLPDTRHATNIDIPQIQMQLNAYNQPSEYVRANREAFELSMRTGKVVYPKYNYAGLAEFDPVKTSIMDAFMSSKPKHITRVDELFNSVPVEDLDIYVKLRRTLLGHENLQIPKFEWNDIDKNRTILRSFKYQGNLDELASSPKKMELYYENMYANFMLGSRQIAPYDAKINNISIEDYILREGGKGGEAFGRGVYIQTSKYVNYGNLEAIIEPKLKIKIEHPLDIFKPHKELFSGYVGGDEHAVVALENKNAINNYNTFVNSGDDFRFRPIGKHDQNEKELIDKSKLFIREKKTSSTKTNVIMKDAMRKFKEHHKVKYDNSIFAAEDKLEYLDKRAKAAFRLEHKYLFTFNRTDGIQATKEMIDVINDQSDLYTKALNKIKIGVGVSGTIGVGVLGKMAYDDLQGQNELKYREYVERRAENQGISIDDVYEEIREENRIRKIKREERYK